MSSIRMSDDGFMYINDARIDALVQSYELSGTVLMEREATEGMSGKTAHFTGFDDTTIVIKLRLATGDRYASLRVLTEAFKKLENGVPVVYTLDFRLEKAMSIETAIISDVRITKGTGMHDVSASVTLTEIDPSVQSVQKQQKQKKAKQRKEDAPVATVSEESELLEQAILDAQDTRRIDVAQGRFQAEGV